MPIKLKKTNIQYDIEKPEAGYVILGFDESGNLVTKNENGDYEPIISDITTGNFTRLNVDFLTVGSRASGGIEGDYSIAQGTNIEASGEASFSQGQGAIASSSYSYARGENVEADGLYAYVAGKGGSPSDPLISSGENSFVHQVSDVGPDYGSKSDYSVILGGQNHKIDTGANSSAIIGGSGNTMDTNVKNSVILGGSNQTATFNNTVYVPNLKSSGDIDGVNITVSGTIIGTNVTSGTDPGHYHTSAYLSNLDASMITSGIFPVSRGGTGLSTVGTNYMLTGNGSSALTAESNLTFNGSTNVLSVTGSITTSTSITAGTSFTASNNITTTSGSVISNTNYVQAQTYLYAVLDGTAASPCIRAGAANTGLFNETSALAVAIIGNKAAKIYNGTLELYNNPTIRAEKSDSSNTNLTIQAGELSTLGGTSGHLYLETKANVTRGSSGNVYIRSGSANGTSIQDHSSGHVFIVTGSGNGDSATSSKSGSIDMKTGSSDGASGNVWIRSYTNSTDNPGTIYITSHASSTNNNYIQIHGKYVNVFAEEYVSFGGAAVRSPGIFNFDIEPVNNSAKRLGILGSSGNYQIGYDGNYSDIRLKDINNYIDNSLDLLKDLNVIKYRWNSYAYEALFNNGSVDGNNPLKIGLIAQEVEKTLPEFVGRDAENKSKVEFLSLNYDKMAPILVGGINELRKLIEEQQIKIDEQQKQIDILLSK